MAIERKTAFLGLTIPFTRRELIPGTRETLSKPTKKPRGTKVTRTLEVITPDEIEIHERIDRGREETFTTYRNTSPKEINYIPTPGKIVKTVYSWKQGE